MSKASILYSRQSKIGNGNKDSHSTGCITIEIDRHDPCPDFICVDTLDVTSGTMLKKKDKSIITIHSCEGFHWVGTFENLVNQLLLMSLIGSSKKDLDDDIRREKAAIIAENEGGLP